MLNGDGRNRTTAVGSAAVLTALVVGLVVARYMPPLLDDAGLETGLADDSTDVVEAPPVLEDDSSDVVEVPPVLTEDSTSAEDVRPTIAVLPFGVVQLAPGDPPPSGLEYGLQQLLSSELMATSALRVVERSEINPAIRELGLSGAGQEAPLAVGSIVGARYLVTGQYAEILGNTRVDIRVIDVQTTEVLMSMADTDPTGGLLGALRRLAVEVIHTLEPVLTGDGQDGLELVQDPLTDLPLEGVTLYSYAVGREEAGEFEEALEALGRLLERWPDYAAAAALRDEIMGR